MKRFSYSERDYTFGQAMLTLRTSMGLTQRGLADLLGISRRAVGDWEAGSSYPKAEHLKRLMELGVQQQAFPAGREAEEIHALWQAARQKLLLDEPWLSTLLGQKPAFRPVPGAVPREEHAAREAVRPRPAPGPRVDWGDALDVPTFYGREQELGPGRHRQVGAGRPGDAPARRPVRRRHLSLAARCALL